MVPTGVPGVAKAAARGSEGGGAVVTETRCGPVARTKPGVPVSGEAQTRPVEGSAAPTTSSGWSSRKAAATSLMPRPTERPT